MSIMGVIPARYASTRFPGKPLADIGGMSLIQRVWHQVAQCTLLDAAIVATDDQRIFEHVTEFGGQAAMTSADHTSGTDRLGEVAESHVHDYYVNIQGDEPLLPPEAIDELIRQTLANQAGMSTLAATLDPVLDQQQIADPNVVKLVRDNEGCALYFSRSPIPYPRQPDRAAYFKHVGIYMYSRPVLKQLCAMPPAELELAESLEQLRALANGIRILAVETHYNPVGVDTPGDIQAVLQRLGQ